MAQPENQNPNASSQALSEKSKARSYHTAIRQSHFSTPQFLIFALIFGLLGLLIYRTFAANPNLPGDINNDNTVSITDVSILLSNFGTTNTTADLNGDGQVSITDLSILLSHYGQSVSGNWTFCANENAQCSFSGTKDVRYGDGTTFFTKTLTDGTACTNGVFGDPTPGADKHCEYQSSTSTPPPPPPTCTGPITITTGGSYTGCWTSTNSSPAVHIATTAPVTIINSTVTNLSGGPLIDTDVPLAVNVTLDRVKAFGGNGRFFEAEDFNSVVIRNCTIEKTSGVRLIHGVAGSTILVTKNRHHNIQRGNGNYGNFLQFTEVQNSTSEVSWNEIINDYNQSLPEDLLSVFKSAHIKIHDNYFQGEFATNNVGPSSQNPVTLENGDNLGPFKTYDNEVWNNQVIDAVGGISMFDGTHDNYVHDNRVIQDGKLPDGVTPTGVGYEAMYIAPNSTNNHEHNNVIGFVNSDGVRNDMEFPGAPEGDAAERAKNTSLPNPITHQMELNEFTAWQQKLTSNSITIGAY